MKKLISVVLAASVFAACVAPFSAQALLLNHREKCYAACNKNHNGCTKDSKGYYMIMKKRECKQAAKKNN